MNRPTVFTDGEPKSVSPTEFHNKREKVNPIPTVLTVEEPKIVSPTVFLIVEMIDVKNRAYCSVLAEIAKTCVLH